MPLSPRTATMPAAGRVAVLGAVGVLLAACGTSSTASTPPAGDASSRAPSPVATESNPPGDIPDDQVYVAYRPPGASFSVKIPEGWARSVKGTAVVFTDKLNSIRIDSVHRASAPTPASVRTGELPRIASSVPTYAPGKVALVSRHAGPAVLVTYAQDSAPDPVTSKVVRQAVERYEFWRQGTTAVLTLSGPTGADNVDPWRIVSDSLRWTG